MWGIDLDRSSDTSLSRQIYRTLRDQITDGQIAAGEAIPSTRELSKGLAVSRNTVSEAYDMLSAEGYITSRQGSPTRVSEGLLIEGSRSGGHGGHESAGRHNTHTSHPDHFIPPDPNPPHAYPILADFHTGKPDLRQFPRAGWLNVMRKAAEDLSLEDYGYTGPEGLASLRVEIAAWLFRSRGLFVSADDIFITAGATHALHLIADLLCHNGRGIVIEDPCHLGMLRVLRSKGYPIWPVPADEQGLRTDLLEKRDAAAVYVTPSHQFPLGGILPAVRRAALIRYARENDAYVIEDDYDSEYRYAGEPVAPLCAMDPERVIYVGTFSKILFQALRIGYIVLPQPLQARWRYLRTHTDVQNPPFEQAALAQFLHTRKLDRHVQRMRRLYGDRRRKLLDALQEFFGSAWRTWGDAAGLHVAVEFPGKCFDETFFEKSRKAGIRITPVEYHSICKGRHRDKLLLSYGHLEPEEITQSVKLLKELLEGF